MSGKKAGGGDSVRGYRGPRRPPRTSNRSQAGSNTREGPWPRWLLGQGRVASGEHRGRERTRGSIASIETLGRERAPSRAERMSRVTGPPSRALEAGEDDYFRAH